MPVMDGIEATQIIRKEISKDVPIIALTANAVTGEKQKCIAAGMNDFLVKPFEEEELIQVIAKWLGINNIFDHPVNKKEIENTNAPLFSIESLVSISRGKKEFITKMLTIFVKEVALSLNSIREAEKNSDIQKIRSVAHRIKPSLNNMGVVSVKNEILKLEFLGDSAEDLNYLPQIINKVEFVLNEVIKQVNALIVSEAY
jgi:response regulator RpfG family c-di-GMP phosphodiesterase